MTGDIHRLEIVNMRTPRGIAKVMGTVISLAGAFTQKRYPAQLSLTTWISAVGAAQSALFTTFAERRPGIWAIGFNIELWTAIYGGVVGSGLIIYIQLWCNEAKGPVFVAIFSPLSTILVAIISYFLLAEKLYFG
ncbi:hypothetical protein KSS87_010910, partial [Heliosperma pusillum]